MSIGRLVPAPKDFLDPHSPGWEGNRALLNPGLFGFAWGPMKVVRVMSNRQKVGCVLLVAGTKEEVEIRCSPSGSVLSVSKKRKIGKMPEEKP